MCGDVCNALGGVEAMTGDCMSGILSADWSVDWSECGYGVATVG